MRSLRLILPEPHALTDDVPEEEEEGLLIKEVHVEQLRQLWPSDDAFALLQWIHNFMNLIQNVPSTQSQNNTNTRANFHVHSNWQGINRLRILN
jgi:hypothetical protein